MSDEVRKAILETIETALDAQLRAAVRRLRRGEATQPRGERHVQVGLK
jgi:hypothetical protein